MTDDSVLARDLRLAVGRFARRLRQLYAEDDGELTFLELAVLQRLKRAGPTSPGSLAKEENVTSAAIAAVLRTLDQKGLVTRMRDPADGRRLVVTISAAGAVALSSREAASVARVHDALVAALDVDELQHLARVIPLIEKVTPLL
ncbi:MarR family winged helix-turn-helix transcriptional regulator [Dactylosporangium sp. CA-092794]|uniref:MarR family winged helix-turn-helix transcriptional regulator n=1 Tax=Dactylosporangium sp. CA-092794 TaxID=3239929 RepID=UPI003D8EEC21